MATGPASATYARLAVPSGWAVSRSGRLLAISKADRSGRWTAVVGVADLVDDGTGLRARLESNAVAVRHDFVDARLDPIQDRTISWLPAARLQGSYTDSAGEYVRFDELVVAASGRVWIVDAVVRGGAPLDVLADRDAIVASVALVLPGSWVK